VDQRGSGLSVCLSVKQNIVLACVSDSDAAHLTGRVSVGQIGVQISTREGEVLKAKRAVDILKATKQGAAPVR